jgi:hypothetical protein
MRRHRIAHSIVACVASVITAWVAPQPTAAADLGQNTGAPAAAAPLSGWTVSLTPYAWATFLNGSSTVKRRTVDLDVDPIQVISHLDRVPFFGYGEIRKGPFALYTDIIYADLALSGSGIHTRNTAALGASLGLNFQQVITEAGGIYEIARWDSGGSLKDGQAGKSFTAIDALGGFRYWNQQLDLSFDLSGTIDTRGLVLTGNKAIARSGTVDWVDPLIGLRLRHQVEPGKELVLRGDIGGFGVGSQFSWNLLAAYNYKIAQSTSLYLGYRALDAGYTQGQGRTLYEFNVIQHGPVTGLTVQF